MINYTRLSPAVLSAYPNPFNGSQITLGLKGFKDDTQPIQLYNQQGIKVFEILLNEDEPGSYKKEITFETALPSGLYILRAGKTLQLTQKIVVK
jgi:hypothetical protein